MTEHRCAHCESLIDLEYLGAVVQVKDRWVLFCNRDECLKFVEELKKSLQERPLV